ncbi:MAG: DUF1501 domain-containing protein [Chloroflexi bacterium]|nr:DUF1501 domain-containing protein [Chloroflexota bacterium]
MTTSTKDPVLVVIQLSGANDYMNTVIPYADPLYYDFRPVVAIPQNEVVPIDGQLAFHPSLSPLKEKFWDTGKMALINGVGYPNPNRSHFRSMDIWHTCEPEIMGTEGWLGRAIRDLDPAAENVLTGVNLGQSLPRALAVPGVPVASVANLEQYGVLTGIEGDKERNQALDVFARMYTPAVGSGIVMDYLAQTGQDILKGADILKVAPAKYSSTVEYADNSIAQALKGIAQVHLADLGTRVFYCSHALYDTHATQVADHKKLWDALAPAVCDFYDDLREHDASDNVVMLLFTEFGRRVRDNGSGTDHGSGGGSFVIGDPIKGGMYSEYPSLKAENQLDGDLRFSYDFRGIYSTILERWLGLDAKPVVGGSFEQLDFI